MRFSSSILSFFAAAAFFILATATSQEDEAVPNTDFNIVAEVGIFNQNIILMNADTFDFVDAGLTINQPLGDNQFKAFSIFNYDLAVGDKDTIPFEEFMLHMGPYPVDTLPASFSIFLSTENGNGTFFAAF